MSDRQSIVAHWNEVLLESIRAGGAKPTATTDQLFLTHAAIYDAWAAYDPVARGLHYEADRAPDAEAADEAVSHAAFDTLSRLFPGRVEIFEAEMDALGLDPASGSAAAGTGRAAAEATFAAREGDGTRREDGYEASGDDPYAPVNSADPDDPNGPNNPEFDPNHWTPLRVPTGTRVDANGTPVAVDDDPGSFVDQTPLSPHWGGVTPFALASGDQVRPDAPPMLGDMSPYTDALGAVSTGDEAYREQFTDVLEASGGLTTRQKVVAEFWADGPRTESPPGHWNQIAQDVALREGHGTAEDAKMFLALNAAVYDAGIATWEAKYEYDFVRPQSAIRFLYQDREVEAWAGPGLGTQTIDGEAWRPYQNVTFVTPPFPEFTSGHSAFSQAAALTIAAFVGDDTYFDGVSVGNYDLDSVEGLDLLGLYETNELSFETFSPDEDAVRLQWDTLIDAADEAGLSRIFGGIHIQDGDLRGREIGRDVAEIAEGRWRDLFGESADGTLVADASGGTLYAGFGADMLMGAGGDDLLKPGEGLDTVVTGAGADTLRGNLEELDGDVISDLSSADAIVIEGLAPGSGNWDPATGLLTRGDAALRVEGPGPFAELSLSAVEDGLSVRLDAPAFETLEGGTGDDRLRGTDASEVIDGGGGALDVASGAGGTDVFAFTDLEGERDRLAIRDFDLAQDALHLGGAQVAATVEFGIWLVLRLEGGDLVGLRGYDAGDADGLRILSDAEFDALALT